MSSNFIEGYSNGDLVEGLFFNPISAIKKEGNRLASGVSSSVLDLSKNIQDASSIIANEINPKTNTAKTNTGKTNTGSPNKDVSDPVNKDIKKSVDDGYSISELQKLEDSLLSGSMTQNLVTLLTTLNINNMIYKNESVTNITNIKKLNKISDLGKSENSNLLDFVETCIINFISLKEDQLKGIMSKIFDKNYGNILSDIYLSLAILNHDFFTSDTSGMEENNIGDLIVISNRLSKYIPDIMIKISSSYSSDSKKSMLMNDLFKKTFKKNETNVSIDLLSMFKPFIDYISKLKTIEMVVIILALAFVASKIFDMFRVKVEV